MEIEDLFIFRCPCYYEIHGWFHCLFRESNNSISTFSRYPNQRCLALYLGEAMRLITHILRPPTRLDSTQRITSFFSVLLVDSGNKR